MGGGGQGGGGGAGGQRTFTRPLLHECSGNTGIPTISRRQFPDAQPRQDDWLLALHRDILLHHLGRDCLRGGVGSPRAAAYYLLPTTHYLLLRLGRSTLPDELTAVRKRSSTSWSIGQALSAPFIFCTGTDNITTSEMTWHTGPHAHKLPETSW